MKKTRKILAVLAVFLAGGIMGYVSRSTESMPLRAGANLFGDINGDGAINAGDATELLKYSAYRGNGGGLDLGSWLKQGTVQPTTTEPATTEPAASSLKLPDTDKTLTIVCWTDADLANMFDVYTEAYPTARVAYQNCGGNGTEASTQYATYLNSGDDADLFVAEAGWILNYINDDRYSAPLSDLGISKADYQNAYPYTVEVGTNNNGVLKAASWQAAPGCYAYNTNIAKEYLGVTTPEQMQEKVADWKKFEATAAELKQKSAGKVKICATIGGMWQAFSAGGGHSWVKSKTIQTEAPAQFTDMVKGFVNHGYVDPDVQQWTTDWTYVGLSGKTMGYFYSSWCLGEGAQLEQNGGNKGNWRIVPGPQEFYWGGCWLCVSPNCNTASEAARFVKSFTIDDTSMEKYALYSGDMVNNTKAMSRIIADGSHSNALLGGQDQFAVLNDVAKGIEMSKSITRYDQSLKDTYLYVLKDNVKTDSTSEIISKFTAQATADNPDLSY